MMKAAVRSVDTPYGEGRLHTRVRPRSAREWCSTR